MLLLLKKVNYTKQLMATTKSEQQHFIQKNFKIYSVTILLNKEKNIQVIFPTVLRERKILRKH